jgi:riboflavin biosynthesis pyrimidine reductase
LYLEEHLHTLGSAAAPFVYASFVSSLDGRIALADSGADALKDLTGAADFRLFLELHAQADCLVTHGGYLRALASGRLGNVLQVNSMGGAEDLVTWRRAQGLPPQPAIAVASATLDFPLPASIAEHAQPLYVFTGRRADPMRVKALSKRGLEVIVAGAGRLAEGALVTRALGNLGYRSLFLLAGPRMLETMVRDRILGRLFLTMRHRLLGGERIHTMIEGAPLGALGEMRLRAMHYQPPDAETSGQWFSQFEPAGRED